VAQRLSFSRAFKNSLGETPYQYILRSRVERAKAILGLIRPPAGGNCHRLWIS